MLSLLKDALHCSQSFLPRIVFPTFRQPRGRLFCHPVQMKRNSSSTPSSDSMQKKPKATKAPKAAKKELSTTIPKNFETIYHLIEEMRSKRDAPVDSNGTECCADRNVEPKLFRYQTLIGLMLSSQTKDEITMAAMLRLRKFGLTPENIRQTSEEKLQELIKPVGFYKRKAGYLKRATEILLEKYDGDIPDNIQELVKLPGVGPKMGYLALKVAWNKVDGIGVDVHVHRIANRLEWAASNTPEQTREQLEAWLPKKYWFDINLLLVGFGQQICASSPKCEQCKITGMCPFYKQAHKGKELVLSDSEDVDDDDDDDKEDFELSEE